MKAIKTIKMFLNSNSVGKRLCHLWLHGAICFGTTDHNLRISKRLYHSCWSMSFGIADQWIQRVCNSSSSSWNVGFQAPSKEPRWSSKPAVVSSRPRIEESMFYLECRTDVDYVIEQWTFVIRTRTLLIRI